VAGSSAVNHIVVVGLMGSGKTTIGRAVAQALGRPFSDSDLEIERTTGRTVRELALERGIAAMHELEARHLLGALAATEPSVIAAAASTVDQARCRAQLQRPDVTVVWLRAALSDVVARAATGSHRPDLGDLSRVLAEQESERYARFEQLEPAAVIETTGKTVPELTAQVLAKISAPTSRTR
jgi:shikimate kinase